MKAAAVAALAALAVATASDNTAGRGRLYPDTKNAGTFSFTGPSPSTART